MSHLTEKERRTLWRVLIGFAFVFWILVFFAVGAMGILSGSRSQDLSRPYPSTTQTHESPSTSYSEVPAPTQKEMVNDWYRLGGEDALRKLEADASSDTGVQSICTSLQQNLNDLKALPLFPDEEAYGYLSQFIQAEENAVSTCLAGDFASANLYQKDANNYLFKFKARAEGLR